MELAEKFGSSEREEVIEVPEQSKWKDLLIILAKRLEGEKRVIERTMDQLIIVCNGRSIALIEKEPIPPDSFVWIGYMIGGG